MGRRKGRKKSAHFIKTFAITFTVVVAAGLLALFAYRWVREGNAAPGHVVDRESVGRPGGGDADEDAAEADQTRYGSLLDDAASMEQSGIYVKEAASPEEVTLVFAGDILFDSRYAVMSYVKQQGGDITAGIAPEVVDIMQGADIMMLNNEFPYSDGGTPLPEKQFTFRAAPDTADYLQELGVDVVSLANNHAYDYGEAALLDTLDTLDDRGIAHVGAGRNLEDASRPVCYIVNDMRIAIVSATQIERLDHPDTKGASETSPGVFRCWDSANLLDTVRRADEENDLVIVYIHWGTENQTELDWAQEKQAGELAEAGADLIIGDHPHCLQQIGVVDGVPVIFSLGNFWFNSKTLDTGLVRVTVRDDAVAAFQFIPCLQSGCRTTLLDGAEKERVLAFLRNISGGVSIDGDGYVTWTR